MKIRYVRNKHTSETIAGIQPLSKIDFKYNPSSFVDNISAFHLRSSDLEFYDEDGNVKNEIVLSEAEYEYKKIYNNDILSLNEVYKSSATVNIDEYVGEICLNNQRDSDDKIVFKINNKLGLEKFAIDGNGNLSANNYLGLPTYSVSDIVGLQSTLDSKSNTSHNHDLSYAALNHIHSIANVTGLQSALDDKASSTHNHTASQITDFNSSVTSIVNSLATGLRETIRVGNLTERNNYNVTQIPTFFFVDDDGDGKWALYLAKTTGTNATYEKVSDPDLFNSAMTGLQVKSLYEGESSSKVNNLAISDIASLQTTLNGKSNTSHNHDTVYLKLTGGTLTNDLKILKSLAYNASANISKEIGTTTDTSVDANKPYKWREYVSGDSSGQTYSIQYLPRGGSWSNAYKINAYGEMELLNAFYTQSGKLIFNRSNSVDSSKTKQYVNSVYNDSFRFYKSDIGTDNNQIDLFTVANGSINIVDFKATPTVNGTILSLSDHTHSISNVTGLQGALDNKANNSHNHDASYSSVNHNHDTTYLKLTGGTLSGNLESQGYYVKKTWSDNFAPYFYIGNNQSGASERAWNLQTDSSDNLRFSYYNGTTWLNDQYFTNNGGLNLQNNNNKLLFLTNSNAPRIDFYIGGVQKGVLARYADRIQIATDDLFRIGSFGNTDIFSVNTATNLLTHNGDIANLRPTSYNSAANVWHKYGASNDTSVNNSQIYQWRNVVYGDANGQNLIFESLKRTSSVWEEVLKLGRDQNVFTKNRHYSTDFETYSGRYWFTRSKMDNGSNKTFSINDYNNKLLFEYADDAQGANGQTIFDCSTNKVVDFKALPTVNGVSLALTNHSHSYLPLNGGTLTGTLTGTQFELNGMRIERSNEINAITNSLYLNYRTGNNVQIGSSTYGQNLTVFGGVYDLGSNPSSSNQLANKQYVDAQVSNVASSHSHSSFPNGLNVTGNTGTANQGIKLASGSHVIQNAASSTIFNGLTCNPSEVALYGGTNLNQSSIIVKDNNITFTAKNQADVLLIDGNNLTIRVGNQPFIPTGLPSGKTTSGNVKITSDGYLYRETSSSPLYKEYQLATASWSGNTMYEYTVTVTGAKVGDQVNISPNIALYNDIKGNANNFIGVVTSANTVVVNCRTSSWVSITTSHKLYITVIPA